MPPKLPKEIQDAINKGLLNVGGISEGDTEAEGPAEFQDWFEGAAGRAYESSSETAWNTWGEGSGMDRATFDALAQRFEGLGNNGAHEMFIRGEFGDDPDSLAEAANLAATTDDPAELQALVKQVQAGETLGTLRDKMPGEEDLFYESQQFDAGDPLALAQVEFGDAGESAFAGDDTDMQGSVDYMQNIMAGGEDDAANFEWNMRKAQAGQAARASREANQAAMETKGLSGSGAELLGDIAGQGQMTDALHMGGLGAAAMQQGRRDSAAGQAYDMSSGIAGELDGWSQFDTARNDMNSVYNNQIANVEGMTNFGRTNQVSDMNTGLVQGDQQRGADVTRDIFGNDVMVTGMEAGGDTATAAMLQGNSQFNQGMDFNRMQHADQMEAMEPNAWDYITGGLGALTGGLTAYGAAKKK